MATTERVPKKMQAIYDEITALTDGFCETQLDEECAQLCRKMTATLARKRPSPLERGRTNTWAASIVYAISQVNFLFDKSLPVHTEPGEIAAAFGVSKTTAGAKAKQIRDWLKIGLLDSEWYRPSQIDNNVMAWMISVNGVIVDARALPREIQEIAYEKGLIPYLPGEPPDEV